MAKSSEAPGLIHPFEAAAGQNEVEPAGAAEAVVMEVEEDGVVTYEAEAQDSLDLATRIQEIVRNHTNTASGELLAMFTSATNAELREHLISAASLVPADHNTRALLKLALSPGQPTELRQAALANAADQDPDLLLPYASDPDLKVEIESLFDDPAPVDESRTIGKDRRPPSTNLIKPPADANLRNR